VADIVTYDSRFAGKSRAELAASSPSSVGDTTPPVEGVALDAEPAVAMANAGRWIALCPNPDCAGAEYVSFLDPLFFCHECRNAHVGHMLIPVTIPDGKTRTVVETYLTARPVPKTRNWHPSEPIKLLRDENRANGIRLPS
jgi:hypothetical protein